MISKKETIFFLLPIAWFVVLCLRRYLGLQVFILVMLNEPDLQSSRDEDVGDYLVVSVVLNGIAYSYP